MASGRRDVIRSGVSLTTAQTLIINTAGAMRVEIMAFNGAAVTNGVSVSAFDDDGAGIGYDVQNVIAAGSYNKAFGEGTPNALPDVMSIFFSIGGGSAAWRYEVRVIGA